VLERLRDIQFGYLPYQPGAKSPGDRRRFPAVAQKLGLNWEIYRPGKAYDVIYVTSNSDLTVFHRWPQDGTKLIYEMVDSYLAVPTWEPLGLVRGIGKWIFRKHKHLEPSYRKTVAAVCRRADLVICSTPEQREQMTGLSPNVHSILDMHEELGGLPSVGPAPGKKRFDIFWEGLGLTATHFSIVAPVLRELNEEFPLRLHFLTDLKYRPINAPIPLLETKRMLDKTLPGLEFYLAEWNPVSVRAIANQADLGIIPLRLNEPLFRAKPENKLLLMWRLGLPVVTSATPAYVRTMQSYGGPDWSCRTTQEWAQNLHQALADGEARSRAAQKGAAYAEAEYGVEALLGRWICALETLLV